MVRRSRLGSSVASVLLGLLAPACGVGSAGIAGATGGGGGGNSGPSISGLRVEGAKAPPATVRFVLADQESDPATVTLLLAAPGTGFVPLTALGGAANPATLATSPAGVEHAFAWEFPDEAALPDDARFVEGVTVFARLGGAGRLVLGANAAELGMGNDPPAVSDVTPPAGESSGIVGIELMAADSSADVVSIRVEYNATPGFPDGEWHLARPALADQTPDFGIEGVVADSDPGTPLSFFWDTEADLGTSFDGDVRVRFTPLDELEEGDPAPSPTFQVDNNAEPVVVLRGEGIVANADGRRGIPLPVRIFDEEGDVVRLVVQWRRPTEEYPLLDFGPDEIDAVLADPRRRRMLRIAAEFPTFLGGRARPLGPARLRLPELSSEAAALQVQGLDGSPLELLRPAPVRPLGLPARGVDVVRPVGVVSTGDGRTVLVLDAPAEAGWRLRELELATGAVVRSLATGTGAPSALAAEPDGTGVLVASEVLGGWKVERVDLADGSVTMRVPPDVSVVPGPVRGLAALGTEAALATAGDALLYLSYAEAPARKVVALLEGLAEPLGVVRDPLSTHRVYVAERGADRVLAFELDSHAVRPLAVTSPDFGRDVPGPEALLVERTGGVLLVVTDGVPGDGEKELRALELGGPEGNRLTLVAVLPEGGQGLGGGPDGLRIVALAAADDLAVGGGLEQRRTIVAHDALLREVTVDFAFHPPARIGQTWRVPRSGSSVAGSPEGTSGLFVWDSSEVIGGGLVHLRVSAFDEERGAGDETVVSKRVVHAFEEPTVLSPGGAAIEFPDDVLARDADGDGDLDLIVAGGPSLAVLFQTSPGDFDSQPLFIDAGAAEFPLGVVATDLDSDGSLDLAFTTFDFPDPSMLTVLLQRAPGAFEISTQREGGSLPLVAGDLDGDGDLDLATSDFGPELVRIFHQQGPGAFEGAPLLVSHPDLERLDVMDLGDVDGDGTLDVVAGDDTIVTLLGDGAGAFVAGPSFPYPFASALDLGDMDGDGDLDLITSDGGNVGVLLQTAPGLFDPEPVALLVPDPFFVSFTFDVRAADLEGDGDNDVLAVTFEAFGSSLSHLNAFEQFEPGRFDPKAIPLDPPDGAVPQSMEAADVDGDGDLDLLYADSAYPDSGPRVLLQERQGRFGPEPTTLGDFFTSTFPGSVAVADLDRDGDFDLATANSCAENNFPFNVSLFFQESPGSFGTEHVPTGGGAPSCAERALVAADLDGDGDVDLAAQDFPSLGLLFQTAPGVLGPDPVLLGDDATSTETTAIGVADLDQDGDLDLAALGYSGEIHLFLQESPGTYPDPPRVLGLAQSIQARSMRVDDLDGDGDSDLVIGFQNDMVGGGPDGLAVFEQGAPGEFAASAVLELAPGTFPYDVEAADLDGDGDVDLISANAGTDELTLFRQLTPGAWASAPEVLTSPGMEEPWALEAGDLDGDGDTDLVSAHAWSDETVLFFQTSAGVLEPRVTLPAPEFSSPRAPCIVDLDGDGDRDLVGIQWRLSRVTVHWGGR